MKPILYLITCALVLSTGMVGKSAWAESVPDYERLADAIRLAEGNSNYGVLTHYKHTSYRQACINTCKHAWLDYQKSLAKGLGTQNSGYLRFLSQRYCPIGAANDPNGLNVNWLRNVSYYYYEKI